MTLRIGSAAQADIGEALSWYGDRSTEVAAKFIAALDDRLDAVRERPLSYPIVHRDLRRARLEIFPYSLLFRVDRQGIVVVACFHGRRSPTSWKRRAG